MSTTPAWLRERNNDPYGTPNQHPFWETVSFERVGDWKIFELDGAWYGHDARYNTWWTFQDEQEARDKAGRGSIDMWA